MKEQLEKIIKKAIKSLGWSDVVVLIDPPKDRTHRDYSTNVSFELAKILKKSPNEVANLLKSQIEKNEIFKKVEVVGGFINFFINNKIFINNLKKVLKEKEDFGKNKNLKNQKVVVEHTNVNPFKKFHIGHLNNNAIGESLSRIFDFHGAKVKSVTYQGDVGIHVARAIWAKLKNPNLPWQEAYAYGTRLEEESEGARGEIIEINKKIYERSDREINKLYDDGKTESLDRFKKIYEKIDTKFDHLFFESEVADAGKKIVEDGLKKDIFEKGENGAIIFKGEKYGLHTRVFINSERLPTYEAKELGLAKIKYDKYKYDKSVVVTGNEINEYFKVLLCVMKQIFPELEKKTHHIGHGMLRLPEGKMSSRTGNVITAEELIEKSKNLIMEKFKEKELDENIREQVAIGSIKYSVLKQSIGSDIIYDFDKSISFEGDSGPYLQYSYARAKSVLEKAKKERIKSNPNMRIYPNNPNSLERMMIHFPEIVHEAGNKYEPHIIATYLIELAREFNNYYAKNKIVDKEDEFSSYKIAMTEAFSIVMKNGLWLLGIPVLERM